MKEQSIKVVLCKVGEKAQVTTITNHLKTFQRIVKDIISLYWLDDQHAIVCGDNSKILGYPLNRVIFDDHHRPIDIIAGDFFIVDASGEDFRSLNSKNALKYVKEFEWPEEILMVGNRVINFPYNPQAV